MLACAATAALLATSLAGCNAILGIGEVELIRPDGGRRDGGDDGDVNGTDGDTEVPPRPDVFEPALGRQHSCARRVNGEVRCWGDDTRGQTGSGGSSDGGLSPFPVGASVNDARSIASRANHTCVTRSTGRVACWGDNQDGQLGNGETNTRSGTPVTVLGAGGSVDVACGSNFACALRNNGRVECWGGGLGGQLGNGTAASSATPVAVLDLADAVDVAAGEAHACAARLDGTVVCWGDNTNGQLGDGSFNPSRTPIAVEGVAGAVEVSATQRSSCARTSDGVVLCWGAGELGQLGRGTPVAASANAQEIGGLVATQIAGGAEHFCAVTEAGTVACWGAGAGGQLGDGVSRPAGTVTASPVTVSGLTGVSAVACGESHSCATRRNESVACWGTNGRAQLGDGTQTGSLVPVNVLGYP